ncbi:MAG TPA: hypothetical protein VFU05_15745, partial [Cyclobacteriaceae bacterium]|nr:hypothetical protein [Cyclobacteriaceae bacterium]
MRLFSLFLVGILPLFAFQCGHQRWAKYASKFKIEVNPRIIELHGDTLSFEILIDPTDYEIKPDQRFVYEIYGKGNGSNLLIDKIVLDTQAHVRKKITRLMHVEERITLLDIIVHEYNSDKLVLTSPP